MPFNQSKYANEFAKEKYDRLNIQVPKGQKLVIEEHWKSKGYKSLNAYVNDLIKKDMVSNGNHQEIKVEQNTGIIMGDNRGTINM